MNLRGKRHSRRRTQNIYILKPALTTKQPHLNLIWLTGHFTQLVWKTSREIGIGRAQSRDGKWFVVANFIPAGNFVGQNANNVFPAVHQRIVPKLPAQGCNACALLAENNDVMISNSIGYSQFWDCCLETTLTNEWKLKIAETDI